MLNEDTEFVVGDKVTYKSPTGYYKGVVVGIVPAEVAPGIIAIDLPVVTPMSYFGKSRGKVSFLVQTTDHRGTVIVRWPKTKWLSKTGESDE